MRHDKMTIEEASLNKIFLTRHFGLSQTYIHEMNWESGMDTEK